MTTQLNQVNTAKAPWTLKGQGMMFLFHCDAAKTRHRKNFLPETPWGRYLGGLGAMMLVDYESSNVGPYRELLFIPGRFQEKAHKAYSISRIWVSTEDSVVNGRANWGIPKNLASFKVDRSKNHEESWSVSTKDCQNLFDIKVKFGRLPLPIHTNIIPLPLIQKWEGRHFLTKHRGFGWGRLATIQSMDFNPDIFPDLGMLKPLVGLYINPFKMFFPRAEMLEFTPQTAAFELPQSKTPTPPVPG